MTKTEVHSPGARVDIGDAILEHAKSVDTKPIKDRLATFADAQKRYVAAEKVVVAAEKKLHDAELKVAEANAALDDCVNPLADALVLDGAPRLKPFAALGGPAPVELKRLPEAAKAKAAAKLAAAAQKRGGSHARKAALALAKAAAALAKSFAPVAALAKAATATIARRQPLGLAWETALASLKRGARAAADDGAPGLYDALFASLPHAPHRPHAAASPASSPAPTQGSTPTAPAA